MSRARRTTELVLLAAAFLLFLGCGKASAPTGPALGTTVVVTGEVVEVQDQTPVDGGVTITVTSQEGGTERLRFPSLRTAPPPSEEALNLYDLLRRVEVGDLVRVRGKRSADGLQIESFAILGGRL